MYKDIQQCPQNCVKSYYSLLWAEISCAALCLWFFLDFQSAMTLAVANVLECYTTLPTAFFMRAIYEVQFTVGLVVAAL